MNDDQDFAQDDGQDGADLIQLVDEDGEEHNFELVDSAELDGREYMALVPLFEDAADLLEDSGSLVFLRVTEEDGESVLQTLDDEEFDKVGAFFMERLALDFDFDYEEDLEEAPDQDDGENA